jgi:hypothetical protein
MEVSLSRKHFPFAEPEELTGVFVTREEKERYKEEKAVFSRVMMRLTAKCGGNVHDKGAVEMAASSVYDSKQALELPGTMVPIWVLPRRTKRVSRFAFTSRRSGSRQRTPRSGHTTVTRIRIT